MSNFGLSPLGRALPLGGVVALALLGVGAPAAATGGGGNFYRAELAQPASDARFVSRDVVWVCDGASCVAGRGTSRPVIMCAALAKKAGTVASFVADGKALEADDLARCNSGK